MPITRNGMMLASLKRGTSQIGFVFQGTVQIWAHEVVIVLGNASAILLKSYFDYDPAIWASTTPKRIVVPPGVEIGSVSASYAIAIMPTAEGQAASWGGTLTLENRGTISGRGGAANSGVGGNAIYANLPGKDGQQLIINNHGTIRAGGGGGGRGGNGGGGYYQTPYTVYQPSSGWYTADYNNYVYVKSNTSIRWAGTWIVVNGPNMGAGAPYTSGIYTYYMGERLGTTGWYDVRRTYTAYNTNYTSGGSGGNGGRGQGYDGANAAGANGAAGGTNAGTGGKGGTGGGWGNAGSTGNTGASGNNGGGSAGAVGGLAGYYLTGQANAVLNNFGSVLGRLN